MKVFFASLTDLTIEVDAWVPTSEQGLILLEALASHYREHQVVMRARMKKYQDYEERFIGPASGCEGFLHHVAMMGRDEPIEGEAS